MSTTSLAEQREQIVEYLVAESRAVSCRKISHLAYLSAALAKALNQHFPEIIFRSGEGGPESASLSQEIDHQLLRLKVIEASFAKMPVASRLIIAFVCDRFARLGELELDQLLCTPVYLSKAIGSVYTANDYLEDAKHLGLRDQFLAQLAAQLEREDLDDPCELNRGPSETSPMITTEIRLSTMESSDGTVYYY